MGEREEKRGKRDKEENGRKMINSRSERLILSRKKMNGEDESQKKRY